MALGLLAAAIPSVVSAVGGLISGRKAKKDRENLIKKMPKYQITEEASQNQAIARSQAFGKDRSIQAQRTNIEQDTANAVSAAKDVTSSTSDLLSTIAAIKSNSDATMRGLAQDEATIQNQKVGQLYGVNSQMIDEKDKQWRQNVYAPWAAKMGLKTEQAQNNQNMWNTFLGGSLQFLGNQAGNIFGSGNTQQ